MKSPPPDIERARSALSHLSPDCSRDTWVRLAMSLKNGFGDAGFEIWDEWSSSSEKYRASDAKATWKSINSDGNVTIGTLYYEAQHAGWTDRTKYKKPTKAEIDARKAAVEARAAQAAEEDRIRHEAAAARAQGLWDEATPCDSHPYLESKGVKSYGLRVGRWELLDDETGGWVNVTNQGLLIPVLDRHNKLWSLQCIFPESGKKMLLRDGSKKSNFFPIGRSQKHDDRPVYILGEGYATCASVHAATGHMVLVCFDAGKHLIYGNHRPQLRNVTDALKKRIKIIPFMQSFIGREDPTLATKLREESSFVLFWLLEGHAEWIASGCKLPTCEAIVNESQDYFEAQSTVEAWIRECVTVIEDDGRCARNWPKAGSLYQDYRHWKELRGEHPVSQTRWGETMSKMFKKQTSDGVRYIGADVRPF